MITNWSTVSLVAEVFLLSVRCFNHLNDELIVSMRAAKDLDPAFVTTLKHARNIF